MTETNKRLGQAVHARRRLLGLTQTEAAARAKISVRSLRDLEAGKIAVGIDTLEKVLHGLAWSWTGVASELAPAFDEGLPPAEVRHLFEQSWRHATQDERKLLQVSLRMIASGEAVALIRVLRELRQRFVDAARCTVAVLDQVGTEDPVAELAVLALVDVVAELGRARTSARRRRSLGRELKP